jgi:hypothetical protein
VLPLTFRYFPQPLFSKTFNNQHRKGNERQKTSPDTAALKVLELIRVNNISGHLFCLKLNASIENESLRADFQSKLEDEIRYMARKLAERLRDGIWNICRILTWNTFYTFEYN